jgi:membrane protein DedA with SNARE-associated domain
MTFEQIVAYVQSQPLVLIYAILFVSAFVENLLPPFPGDAVMLAGAFLAGRGHITYIGVLLSTVAGGLAGAMTLYFIGKTAGRKFFETGKGRFLVKTNLSKAENMFEKYGSLIIVVSRFLAGIRSAIAVAAGIVRYDSRKMLSLTTVSFFLWYGLLTSLMVYSKSNSGLIIELVKKYNLILLIVGFLILIAWIIKAWIRKRLKSRS